MNKLRKLPSPEKPTDSQKLHSNTDLGPARPSGGSYRSVAEQYWAARALTAETLLSARKEHDQELRTLAYREKLERSRELSVLERDNANKLSKLERIVTALFALVVFLVLIVGYLAMFPPRPKERPTGKMSHFTVPILSPFTSVVEHEVSVIGPRLLSLVFVLLTGLAYFLLRHRLHP